ncbi:hypothetical protein DFP72DRAFT_642405 [Ephemerocybe angulata]|uniref:Uncharacterized protein n=1 Tax=Ephemerocybe angulata TaxID=980116 RepID=A0A8H6HFH3_9AGAR|nr:hypothetical protein DFP72DRAFT_642405 [Tulosesus angulatus]
MVTQWAILTPSSMYCRLSSWVLSWFVMMRGWVQLSLDMLRARVGACGLLGRRLSNDSHIQQRNYRWIHGRTTKVHITVSQLRSRYLSQCWIPTPVPANAPPAALPLRTQAQPQLKVMKRETKCAPVSFFPVCIAARESIIEYHSATAPSFIRFRRPVPSTLDCRYVVALPSP